MTIELQLLKVLSDRKNYENYVRLINPKILSRESIYLLQEYKAYFESTDSVESQINWSAFSTFFFIQRHPNMDGKSIEKWKDIINRLQNVTIVDTSCIQIITAFKQQEFYTKLHRDLDDNKPIQDVYEAISRFNDSLKADTADSETLEEEMNLNIALDTTDRQKGLKWRLNCLNEAAGPLIKSDFIIFAAPVGSGKTSFLASECSFMAQQLIDNQKILWFNNEGNWKKILLRLYSATLNCTEQDLRSDSEGAKSRYNERMKNDLQRIKVFDIKGKNTKDIEKIVLESNPGLIIIDMLDKVAGYEIYLKGESGATERYNQLYAWAEQLADHAPVIVTSQLNGDGYNKDYPDMSCMRGSRVDKQANGAAVIIMGALKDCPHVRYLSTPKNKLTGNETFRSQVQFDALRSRYKD